MRKLLLLFVMCFVSIGMWAEEIPGNGGEYVVQNGVATFSGVKAGAIDSHWNALHLNGATRIVFDNTCEINKADLERFLQGNTYYVDLFDITNGTSYDAIISEAIQDMKTNSWQAKGIIMPYNSAIGTSTAIQAIGNGLPTFSEYAAYYRSSSKVSNIYVYSMQTYYYQLADNTQANTQLATAASHLFSHPELNDADVCMVGTNNVNKLDLSPLPSGKTEIEIIADDWVKPENAGLADIYVFATEAGHLDAAVVSTGINYTPCDKLVISGPVNSDDVKAVNDFGGTSDLESVEGPHLYDLKDATGAVLEDFSQITNDKVEYIILPTGITTESIEPTTFSSAMTNLKAAVTTSSDKTFLSAYVKVAGSLAKARYYATGGSVTNGVISPTKVGLTDVVLSGSLNAADIVQQINEGAATKYLDANGHWSASYAPNPAFGLNQETGIKTFDLENAVFTDQHDMNFNYAGYEYLTSVKLPTSEEMTTIPANSLNNIKTLTYLCVPYNYQYIEDGAFWNSGLGHITTTDGSGAEVDNGPGTWTISANMKELGTKPDQDKKFVFPVFPQNVGVEEIYCLAVKVPKCYANVFPANACYGWGGSDSNMPYCRDKYYNGGNKNEAWAVLRFPSEDSWANSAGDKESSYDVMKQLYTDVKKEFTKLEQTGAVDANGDPIVWPTRMEANRAYNQASFGLTWNDWVKGADGGEDGSVPGGQDVNQSVNAGSVYTYENVPATGPGDPDVIDNFNDYMGWHQIVLSQATYVKPDEIIENEEIVRYYEEAGLYTFCIPYDMTADEVLELMGVPASDPTKKIKSMLKATDSSEYSEVTTSLMPEIYQLHQVTRKKGTSATDNNVVHFILTSDLYNNGNPQYLEFTHGETEAIDLTPAADGSHPNRCLLGGRPYIIKAYKRVNPGAMVDQYKISGQNLGLNVMTRYADKFDESASCVNNGLYEQLGTGNLKTLQFAIPYEQHKVQAVKFGEDASPVTYENGAKKYFYTMVGQYWEQDLPLYCIYMSKGRWYRYSTPNNYTWAPYKCIIMPTQEINDKGGGYRSDERSNYPNITGDDFLDGTFQLGFLDGRDDDDFKTNNGAKYMFIIDNGFDEYDAEGNLVTSIKQLDGENLTIGSDNGKVYNMSGQYVGKSVNGLQKGMYIVNGKKYVVK